MNTTVALVLGLIMLVAGRKLFWLFVGVAGFALGLSLSQQFFPDLTENGALVAGILCGIVGAVVALFLQKIALVVAGFAAGGIFLLNVVQSTAHVSGVLDVVIFVAGGIVGAILASLVFDWALVILSSLVGATLVVQSLHLQSSPLFICAIALVGILIQAQFLKKHPPAEKEE